MSVNSIRNLLVLTAVLPFVVGCTESTTSKDVADARQKVADEQKDVEQTRREAMKPTIDEGAAQNIQKEERDVAAAKNELDETQRMHTATQARDAFALGAQKALDAADIQIKALKSRADSEEGAAKEATQQQIEDLQTRRDRLNDALGKLKKEDLMKWTDHRSEVQTAMAELTAKLGASR
jgi:hypothetical protein